MLDDTKQVLMLNEITVKFEGPRYTPTHNSIGE